MYTYEEYIEMQKLMKSPINSQEVIDDVERLFIKYKDPYFRGPLVKNCTCSKSVATVFAKLREWFEANQNLFKQNEE